MSIGESASKARSVKRVLWVWPSRAVRELLLVPIRFYRRFLSRLKPVSTCRFSPTCSAYAEEALRTHGVFRSLGLIAWRLMRCQPFAKAGYDPVPPARVSPPSHR
jgi:putative membrane protein insertion efficiency factor